MGNQGKFTKRQSRKTNVFLYISRSDFTSGDETYTAGGETTILGLPAVLSRSSECCGRTSFFLQLRCLHRVLRARAPMMRALVMCVR